MGADPAIQLSSGVTAWSNGRDFISCTFRLPIESKIRLAPDNSLILGPCASAQVGTRDTDPVTGLKFDPPTSGPATHTDLSERMSPSWMRAAMMSQVHRSASWGGADTGAGPTEGFV